MRREEVRNDSIARRLASQMWGQVQFQKKLTNGIWLFSTASHGGIVVDTNIHPEVKNVASDYCVGVRSNSPYYWPAEQHFVAMEEDGDAPVVEWLYAEKIITPNYQKQFCTKDMAFPEWKAHRLSIIKESLSRWRPEVLTLYPAPNMGMEKEL